MAYVAVTLEGIEDVCAKELKGKKLHKGRVLFKKLKKDTRSAETIFTLNKQCTSTQLEDMEAAVANLDFPKKSTYRVTCKRKGKHKFKSVDVEKTIGKVLYNKGYKIDLKKPEQIVYIDIVDNSCCIGTLLQERLCKRAYRVKINNQSINACLAFALLKILKWKKEEALLDPFCKDGIIAIEAALLGGKKVYATDPNQNSSRNASINAKMAKVKVTPLHQELSQLETIYKAKNIAKIATTIITSKKDKQMGEKLKAFFQQAKKIVKKEIGIITNSAAIEKEAKEYFSKREKRKIKVGKAEYYLYIFKKINQKIPAHKNQYDH